VLRSGRLAALREVYLSFPWQLSLNCAYAVRGLYVLRAWST
jgi:hypothetical protein